MNKWLIAHNAVLELEKQGKVRIEEVPIPREECHTRQHFTTTYFLTCQHCGAENPYINPPFLLERMKVGFCRKCNRENPDSYFFKKKNKYIEYPRKTTISIDFPTLEINGIADIYCRVSTKKQEHGDGLRRQEESGIIFCKKNQIKIRNIIHDVGSAYNKDNCIDGNLGKKMKMWESNKESAPTYLVIEDMDRFSRQRPYVAMSHVSRIKNLNIKLAISNGWDDDIIY